ncbi:hypothetical protein ACFL4D_03315, partial [Candidatus Margulisiibacteriota bacterium]
MNLFGANLFGGLPRATGSQPKRGVTQTTGPAEKSKAQAPPGKELGPDKATVNGSNAFWSPQSETTSATTNMINAPSMQLTPLQETLSRFNRLFGTSLGVEGDDEITGLERIKDEGLRERFESFLTDPEGDEQLSLADLTSIVATLNPAFKTNYIMDDTSDFFDFIWFNDNNDQDASIKSMAVFNTGLKDIEENVEVRAEGRGTVARVLSFYSHRGKFVEIDSKGLGSAFKSSLAKMKEDGNLEDVPEIGNLSKMLFENGQLKEEIPDEFLNKFGFKGRQREIIKERGWDALAELLFDRLISRKYIADLTAGKQMKFARRAKKALGRSTQKDSGWVGDPEIKEQLQTVFDKATLKLFYNEEAPNYQTDVATLVEMIDEKTTWF